MELNFNLSVGCQFQKNAIILESLVLSLPLTSPGHGTTKSGSEDASSLKNILQDCQFYKLPVGEPQVRKKSSTGSRMTLILIGSLSPFPSRKLKLEQLLETKFVGGEK